MYIVVDTNALYGDPHLKNTGIVKLAAKAREQGYKLCFPRPVILEHIKHYYEHFDAALKELKKAEKKLQEQIGVPLDLGSKIAEMERGAKRYGVQLRKRVRELDGTILNMPSKDRQMEILKKAVHKLRPFKANGIGCPDAVIWGSIMDLAKKYSDHPGIDRPRIIFVTKNSDDFCAKDSTELHQDLVADLDDVGVVKEAVLIVKTLDEASATLLTHSDEIISGELKALFMMPESRAIRIDIEHRILEAVNFMALDNEQIGLGIGFENPSVDMIHEDYVYSGIRAEHLPEEQISISLNVSFTCLLDVFVEKSEAMHMEDLSIYDHDWNNYYVAAQIEKTIWFEVNVITDNSFGEILNFEITPDEELNNQADHG